MTRLTVLGLSLLALSHAACGAADAPKPIRLGGAPMQLVSARGALWALTCERGCSGEGRRSRGRIVRIDPRTGRVIASATLARPGAIAVGASGVYATDFWRGTVRRLDPATLRVTSTLKLTLPFYVAAHDNSFLPLQLALTASGVWIATNRGALAHADQQLRHVLAMVRLPPDAFQSIAASHSDVWLSESLLGVYRVNETTNRVVARIPIGPFDNRFDPVQIVPTGKQLLATGEWTNAGTLTNRNGLARLDPARNRVEAVTPLPTGQLISTYGDGSLWIGRFESRTLERIDPVSGKTLRRLDARIGVALTFADGHLWTAFRDGTLQQLTVP